MDFKLQGEDPQWAVSGLARWGTEQTCYSAPPSRTLLRAVRPSCSLYRTGLKINSPRVQLLQAQGHVDELTILACIVGKGA
jgi:hypothetical protein